MEPDRCTDAPGEGGRLLLPDRGWAVPRAGGAVAGRARTGLVPLLSASISAFARTGPPERKARIPGPLPGGAPETGAVRLPMQKPMLPTDDGALRTGPVCADGDDPRATRPDMRMGESPLCAGESPRRPVRTAGLSCRPFGDGSRDDCLDPGPRLAWRPGAQVRESRMFVAGPLTYGCCMGIE